MLKKTFCFVCSVLMMVTLSLPLLHNDIYAEEIYSESNINPIETDRLLMGDKIEQEVVLHDPDNGIYFQNINNPNANKLRSINDLDFWDKEVYKSCFARVSWIKRGSEWSLSVFFTADTCDKSGSSPFSVLAKAHKGDWQWRAYPNSYQSMQNQYTCHTIFAKTKIPWNLEPHRPNKSWVDWVKGECN